MIVEGGRARHASCRCADSAVAQRSPWCSVLPTDAGDGDDARPRARPRGSGRARRSAVEHVGERRAAGCGQPAERRRCSSATTRDGSALRRGLADEVVAVERSGRWMAKKRLAGLHGAAVDGNAGDGRRRRAPWWRRPRIAVDDMASTSIAASLMSATLARSLPRRRPAWSENGQHDCPSTIWPVSWPLPATQQHVARRRASHRRRGWPRARSPISCAPGAAARIAARIAAGFSVRGLSSVTMTLSALARRSRPSAAACRRRDRRRSRTRTTSLPVGMGRSACEHLVERVRLVGVVDEDRRAVALHRPARAAPWRLRAAASAGEGRRRRRSPVPMARPAATSAFSIWNSPTSGRRDRRLAAAHALEHELLREALRRVASTRRIPSRAVALRPIVIARAGGGDCAATHRLRRARRSASITGDATVHDQDLEEQPQLGAEIVRRPSDGSPCGRATRLVKPAGRDAARRRADTGRGRATTPRSARCVTPSRGDLVELAVQRDRIRAWSASHRRCASARRGRWCRCLRRHVPSAFQIWRVKAATEVLPARAGHGRDDSGLARIESCRQPAPAHGADSGVTHEGHRDRPSGVVGTGDGDGARAQSRCAMKREPSVFATCQGEEQIARLHCAAVDSQSGDGDVLRTAPSRHQG